MDNKISMKDEAIFYISPLLCWLVLIYLQVHWGVLKSVLTPLVAILSIFSSMLFSFQVMICDQIFKVAEIRETRTDRDSELIPIICELLKDTYVNISYCILIALCALLLALVASIDYLQHPFKILLLSTTIALFLHFVLFLLMIIKRSQKLIGKITSLRIDAYRRESS